MSTSEARDRAPQVFSLEGASILAADRVVLEPFSLTIGPGVTVVLGPAGVGKSCLLRGLSGLGSGGGVMLRGHWKYRGRDIRSGFNPPTDVVLSGQANGQGPPWSEALASGAPTVLLDEPLRREQETELDDLVRAVVAHAEHHPDGIVVLVTHNSVLARAVASDVVMLCAERLHCTSPAASFFSTPPTELAARFLQQGNCWPAAPPPELPSHFRWLEPEQYAGMGRPGLLDDAETDLVAIATAGINVLVSLTEDAADAAQLRAVGIEGWHFPIADMGVPDETQLCEFFARLAQHDLTAGAVAFHCHAGLGRTGTMLALLRVWEGMSGPDAIAHVRRINRLFIQSEAQERFVLRIAEQGLLRFRRAVQTHDLT